MVKFRYRVGSKINSRSFNKYVPIIILLLILFVSQAERFMQAGTILGYQVRTVVSEQAISSRNGSGSIVNGQPAKQNQTSIACETVSASAVTKIVKSDVERISGFVPDRTEPYLISSCIYRVKDAEAEIKSVALLLRDSKDAETAKKSLSALKQAKTGTDVKNLGDEAYFNTSTNQLTVRKGKRLITVTVPKSATSKVENKLTAIEIAKIAIK